VAGATGLSRRAADKAIISGRVLINGDKAEPGSEVMPADKISLDGKGIRPADSLTIVLNKPEGYVCSRNGQGSKTIYELLPEKFNVLKPVGRLDKDSSGLLLLTNEGRLANELTHPRYQKNKVYQVKLNKALDQKDKTKLLTGVELSDGLSKFIRLYDCSGNTYEVTLSEGRNRQIRRTFNALGYKITSLHRLSLGGFSVGNLKPGSYKVIDPALFLR
jgi:pseudouridine synthase